MQLATGTKPKNEIICPSIHLSIMYTVYPVSVVRKLEPIPTDRGYNLDRSLIYHRANTDMHTIHTYGQFRKAS